MRTGMGLILPQSEISNRSDDLVLGVNVLVGEGDAVVVRLLLLRDEQVVLGLEQVRARVDRELEVEAVRDCVLRARFDAEAAEDAAAVVYVVDRGVALVHADSLHGRARVVCGNDVYAVRRARGRAEVARDALLAAEFVHVQKVLAAVARLKRNWLVRVLDSPPLARGVRGRLHHPLDDGPRVLDHVADDAHGFLEAFSGQLSAFSQTKAAGFKSTVFSRQRVWLKAES